MTDAEGVRRAHEHGRRVRPKSGSAISWELCRASFGEWLHQPECYNTEHLSSGPGSGLGKGQSHAVRPGGSVVLDVLRPRLYVPSVFAINLDRLWAMGLRGLIVDLDNTLVSWDNDEASEELLDWVRTAKAHPFQCCLVSNNFKTRVDAFASAMGIPSIHQASKPRRRAFRQAMRLMGTHAQTTAVIGDQLFTDVLGGNRLHCYTILVLPMADREYWTTRLVRRVERLFLPDSDGMAHHE